MSAVAGNSSWFQRFLLPGLAFKAITIGGGYATGRELAEFFIGSGPLGGLMGIVLAMVIWSVVCAITFMLARALSTYEYRSLFQALLGPFWPLFELAYVLLLVLVLAVVAAAAGTIGSSVLGWPGWAGTALLLSAIVAVTTFGSGGAERLFRFSSPLIYAVYALFVIIAFASFGDLIGPQLASDVPTTGWVIGGITYASYNVVAAAAILPFLRHLTSQRDALISGLACGPLAIAPALLFFLCMIAFYPQIGDQTLPSDYLLRQIGIGWFHLLFQAMIFVALLETGVGIVIGLTERISAAFEKRSSRRFSPPLRFAIVAVIVLGCGFLASGVGLVDLIATGYGAFGYAMLVLFVLPLLTIGVRLLLKSSHPQAQQREPKSL